jgi:hypothetical protein
VKKFRGSTSQVPPQAIGQLQHAVNVLPSRIVKEIRGSAGQIVFDKEIHVKFLYSQFTVRRSMTVVGKKHRF